MSKAQNVSWMVHQEGGGWIALDSKIVEYIENHIKQKSETCDFTVDAPGIPTKCRIYFHGMYLLDLSLGLSRKVKRMTDEDKDHLKEIGTVTNWIEILPGDESLKEHSCPICLCSFIEEEEDDIMEDDDLSVVHLSACKGHYFHKNCIARCFKPTDDLNPEVTGHLRCPVCSHIYGTRVGNMPLGFMNVQVVPKPLPGFPPDSYTFHIKYSIPSGIQGPDHPAPGKSFTGTLRHCYLPNTAEGRDVLQKLQTAFKRRLTFTIGNSITSGRTNTVVWNCIHHKTNVFGGAARYGYPDDTYLTRVTDELASVGVV
mmetsp:Transcript_36697/g.63011  ORF Transcript_36697/g.63011 Transcript_36697/m.63011 type:complete len:313 (-) Transcript_36697:744-1682(-)